MSIYTYSKSPVIDEVTFRKTENGGVRAYLHARENANGKLGEVINGLQERGWSCIPATINGQPVLEVRGFNREEKLISELAQRNWTGGDVRQCQDEADHLSFKDKFKKRSLQASGVFMSIADLGFMAYGLKESKMRKMLDPTHVRDYSDAIAGLSYLSGSSVLTAYGRNDQSERQIKQMAKLILEHAEARGLAMPDQCAVTAMTKERPQSALRKVDNFFRAYPSEIGNMMYVVAGSLIAKSALQHHALAAPRPGMTAKQIHEMRKEGWQDTGLGATTVASGLLATFMKEKAPDPDKPPAHGMQAVVDWIREKPLRIAGYGYMVSTLCHAMSTVGAYKEAKRVMQNNTMSQVEHFVAGERLKSVPFRALFVGSTLIGEILMSISSKGHGKGVVSDKSVDNSVIALAADLIVKQPAHMEETLIPYMAKFLGRPDVLAMKDEDVIHQLRTHIEIARNNPWSCLAQAPTASVPQWQAKTLVTQSQPQQPSLG